MFISKDTIRPTDRLFDSMVGQGISAYKSEYNLFS